MAPVSNPDKDMDVPDGGECLFRSICWLTLANLHREGEVAS